MLYFLMVFHVRVTRSKGGTETQQRLRVAKEEVANRSASSDQEERLLVAQMRIEALHTDTAKAMAKANRAVT